MKRRDFLKTSVSALSFLGANALANSSKLVVSERTPKVKVAGKGSFGQAKSVIQIWLWGGPSQIDTWDPKPEAGYDYCGPLNKPIETNVSGIRISQTMPLLAKCADKYSIVRSVTHGLFAHETGAYLVQTGREPSRYVYPCAGAVVSKFKGYDGGYKGIIPPYIVLTQPQGRFSEAGFLGDRYKPFATGSDPSRVPFEVEGIVARGMSRERQAIRRELLKDKNLLQQALAKTDALAKQNISKDQAYELILGDAASAFDISKEPQEIRAMYGNNRFANSCLIARKLVEQGVPYITINYGGWDTHKSHFEAMNRMMPSTDRAISALINDLDQRGLLSSTIVWWSGEFGRTPRVQWEAPYFGGRGHWGSAFSTMLAGGGFKGGSVVGKTDSVAGNVVERPVSPADVIGSIYWNLGIAPDATLTTPQGDVVALTDPNESKVKTKGILKEIMNG